MADSDERERDEFERLRPAGAEGAAELGRGARHAERIEEGAVELRPRGVGEVLDLGLDLVRSRFGMCIALGTLVWMPIQWIAIRLPQPNVTTSTENVMAVFFEVFWQMSWVYVAYGVGDVLVVAMVARIVGDAIEGRRTSAGRALRTAVTLLPGLVVLGLIPYVGCFLMCLCVPGALLLWVITPAPYVYVIEGVGFGAAIRRGIRLSFGELFSWPSFFAFWRWSWILVVGAVLVLPFSFLIWKSGTPEWRTWAVDTLHLSETAWDALRVVLGGLFLATATTVRAGYLTVYYFDCRVRREGLDLERWLARMHAEPKDATSA